MLRAGGLLLLLNGLWNLAVWPQFLRRVQRDPRAWDDQGRPTRFLQVHVAITATAAALGLASLALGGRLTAGPAEPGPLRRFRSSAHARNRRTRPESRRG